MVVSVVVSKSVLVSLTVLDSLNVIVVVSVSVVVRETVIVGEKVVLKETVSVSKSLPMVTVSVTVAKSTVIVSVGLTVELSVSVWKTESVVVTMRVEESVLVSGPVPIPRVAEIVAKVPVGLRVAVVNMVRSIVGVNSVNGVVAPALLMVKVPNSIIDDELSNIVNMTVGVVDAKEVTVEMTVVAVNEVTVLRPTETVLIVVVSRVTVLTMVTPVAVRVLNCTEEKTNTSAALNVTVLVTVVTVVMYEKMVLTSVPIRNQTAWSKHVVVSNARTCAV